MTADTTALAARERMRQAIEESGDPQEKRRAALDLVRTLLAGRREQPTVTAPADSAADKVAEAIMTRGLEAEDDMRAALHQLLESNALTEVERAVLLAEPRPDPLGMFPRTDDVKTGTPSPVLSLSGLGGAILAVGEICLLTGAGGRGKSGLVTDVALAVATPPRQRADSGHFFHAHGPSGPVLWLAFEEAVGKIRDRLQWLTRGDGESGTERRNRVRIADMRDPTDSDMRKLYGTARAYPYGMDRKAGMDMLERAIEAAAEDEPDKAAPRLVIVDTLLRAFSGDPHRPTDVVDYLDELGLLARRYQIGIVGIAHSTKEARFATEKPDDLLNPGAVSGHSQWTDAPRGTLCLTRHWHMDPDGNKRPHSRITAVKANDGPDEVTIRIEAERMRDDHDKETGIARFRRHPGELWQSVYALDREHPQARQDGGVDPRDARMSHANEMG